MSFLCRSDLGILDKGALFTESGSRVFGNSCHRQTKGQVNNHQHYSSNSTINLVIFYIVVNRNQLENSDCQLCHRVLPFPALRESLSPPFRCSLHTTRWRDYDLVVCIVSYQLLFSGLRICLVYECPPTNCFPRLDMQASRSYGCRWGRHMSAAWPLNFPTLLYNMKRQDDFLRL